VNTGQLNGFSLNASPLGGKNATLQGGFASSCAITALVVINAILSGGLYASPETGGRVSRTISGGTYSDSDIRGNIHRAANLQGAIYNSDTIDAALGLAPAFRGGVYGDSSYGGQLISSPKLQMKGTIVDTCFVSSGYLLSAGLYSGISTTSYVTAYLKSQVILMADGVKSSSDLGGLMRCGTPMSDGISADSIVGGEYFTTARLSGSLYSSSSFGKELDIDARLQGGILQLNTVDSPVMCISPMLSEGFLNNTTFLAQIILSPKSNDGILVDSIFDAKYCIDARMSGGIQGSDFTNSISLKAAQKLPGGINSSSSVGSVLITRVMLSSGIESIGVTSAKLIASVIHWNGFASTGSIGGSYRIDAKVTDGIKSTNTLNSFVLVSPLLKGGVQDTGYLDGNRTAVSLLTNGIASSHKVSGDIVQGFADPLLNTWALSIRSATPILSISSPIKDI
jgi:hypothetical protein